METFVISPFITAVCQTVTLENIVTYFSWEMKIGCWKGSSHSCYPMGKKELLVKRIHFTTHPWGYCYIGVPALGHGRSRRSAAAGIFSIRWQLSQIMENYCGCLPGQKCNYAVL